MAFVEQVTEESEPGFVPAPERVAVFDNDGTLWCEKAMPVEVGFILERLADMAADDPSLRGKQPWKAASSRAGGGARLGRRQHARRLVAGLRPMRG